MSIRTATDRSVWWNDHDGILYLKEGTMTADVVSGGYVVPATNELSERFRRMADRLDHNQTDPFGGCFLIVPPKEGGEAIETLILDANQDPSQFWILLKSKCDHQIALLDNKSRSNQAFGRF